MHPFIPALAILALFLLITAVAMLGGAPASALALTASASTPIAPWFGFISGATGIGLWVLGNWSDIAQFIGALIAIYLVVRERQWNKLLAVAGELAYDAAKLAYLDKAERRRYVATQLFERSGAIARSIFTEEQFEMAVETAWQLIAKPRVKTEKA